jgi:hypothetical protein
MDDVRPKLVGARVQRLEDPRLLTGAGAACMPTLDFAA